MILASGNQGKIKEFQQLFKDISIEIQAQSDFDVPEADETGKTFIENALIKARNASHYTQQPAIADDSGLVVPALSGEPGIFSARFAGTNASDQENINLLLERLSGHTDRKAYFYCALVKVEHEKDPTPVIANGKCVGEISITPSGSAGFGYDPVFYLQQFDKTMAELPVEVKNRISHRAEAMKQLFSQLKLEKKAPENRKRAC